MATREQTSATAKLDAIYELFQTFTLSSPESDFTSFGSYFTPNCSANLRSMREEPKRGRQAAVDDLKALVKEGWHIDERRIDAQAEVSGTTGITVFCQMSNRLNIMGDILDPFQETAVVSFDSDGLISDFKLYSCRSPIVRIVQEKTRLGPYSEDYMATPEHLPRMQANM
ncbi:hypothetical protein LTR85_002540 [Meristemomyces frigidus]|nr:hypothetical protein LTR85_002540 [Meristemomyces frigidus]